MPNAASPGFVRALAWEKACRPRAVNRSRHLPGMSDDRYVKLVQELRNRGNGHSAAADAHDLRSQTERATARGYFEAADRLESVNNQEALKKPDEFRGHGA